MRNRDRLNLAIVAANNHYAGFGPGTANTFRKMLDLSEVTWNDIEVPILKEHLVTKNKLVYRTSKMEFRDEVVKQ